MFTAIRLASSLPSNFAADRQRLLTKGCLRLSALLRSVSCAGGGNTFAERLDRAVDASNRAKVIEGRVIRDE